MRRVQMSITIVLLFVVTSLVGAADGPRMLVRDADGKLVGIVLAQSIDIASTAGLTDRSPLWVAKRISGAWILLQVTKNAVWRTKETPFLYENNLCAGPPLLEAPLTSDTVRSTVIFDTQVYWPEDSSSERVIRSRGVLVSDPAQCDGTLLDGNLCCTVPSQEETRVASEVVRAFVTRLNLRPPFHLEPAPAPPPVK